MRISASISAHHMQSPHRPGCLYKPRLSHLRSSFYNIIPTLSQKKAHSNSMADDQNIPTSRSCAKDQNHTSQTWMCASLPRLLFPLQSPKTRLRLGYDQFHRLFQKLVEDYEMSTNQQNHHQYLDMCRRAKLFITAPHVCETSSSPLYSDYQNKMDVSRMFETTAFPKRGMQESHV